MTRRLLYLSPHLSWVVSESCLWFQGVSVGFGKGSWLSACTHHHHGDKGTLLKGCTCSQMKSQHLFEAVWIDISGLGRVTLGGRTLKFKLPSYIKHKLFTFYLTTMIQGQQNPTTIELQHYQRVENSKIFAESPQYFRVLECWSNKNKSKIALWVLEHWKMWYLRLRIIQIILYSVLILILLRFLTLWNLYKNSFFHLTTI